MIYLCTRVGSRLRAQRGEAHCYTFLYNGRRREGGNLEGGGLSATSCPCHPEVLGAGLNWLTCSLGICSATQGLVPAAYFDHKGRAKAGPSSGDRHLMGT